MLHVDTVEHTDQVDAAAPPDLVVVWRIHEHCPLACEFCGYSRTVERPRVSADAANVLRFGQTLAEYGRMAGRSILVSWLGGEPLLWPKLEHVSRVCRNEFGLRLSVTTMGLPLARPDMRRLLAECYEQVTISIDGLSEFHDQVRGQRGLFEQLRGLVRSFRAECEGRVLLRVNTVLMCGNIESFAAFCEEMAAWGFDELTFNQLGGNDRPEFYPDNRLLPEQVERFCAELPAIRQTAAARGLTIRGSDHYLDRIRRTTRGLALPIADCRPGERFLFIDEHNRVSPCSFTAASYGIPLEQIMTAEHLRTIATPFRVSRHHHPSAACADCHATHVFDKFL